MGAEKTQTQGDLAKAEAVSEKAKEVSVEAQAVSGKAGAVSSEKSVMLKKPKKTAVLVGFLVFLTVLGIGFGVTGMILWWQEKNKEPETVIQVEEKTEIVREDGETIVLTTENAGENEQRVKQLLADLASELRQWAAVKNEQGTELPPRVQMVYDTVTLGSILVYRPQGMYTSVVLDKVYGLELDIYDWTASAALKEKFTRAFISEALAQKVMAWLQARGFARYEGNEADYYNGTFLNHETGVLCAVNGGSWPDQLVNCGHVSWFDAKVAEFSNRVATGTSFPEGAPLMLNPDELQIRDSAYAPYQTMVGGMLSGIALWYRVSPEAPWQFFRAGQDAPVCSEYKTEDLKKAYLGEQCWDEETFAISEVKL